MSVPFDFYFSEQPGSRSQWHSRDEEKEPAPALPRTTTVDRCPVDHAAIKRDDAAWSKLQYVGEQMTYDDEPGAAQFVEVRNCTCGTTLCREVRR